MVMNEVANRGRKVKIAPGTEFEYRVARLRFHQGFFVRRAIDVWPTGLEGNKLAELDCLAGAFDPRLRRTLEVMECKTGAGGQGEVDRLVWLRGIERLAGARVVTFAKLQVAPRTRDLARQLQVDVLDEAAIAKAEHDLEISADDWIGFHDPEFGERVVKSARNALNSVRELQGAGKYLFGSFWFTDEFTRVKQLRRAVHLLVRHENLLAPTPLLLGLGEAVTLLTLTVASVAAWQQQLAEPDFRDLVTRELSTGFGDARSLRVLLRRFDDFHRDQIEALHAAYQSAGAGRLTFPVTSLESDILTPPEWVDAFIDLVSRFSRRPQLATNVMRYVDLWSARLLGATVSESDVHKLFGDQAGRLNDMLALIVSFLTRIWRVPAELLALPLTSTTDDDYSRVPEASPGLDAVVVEGVSSTIAPVGSPNVTATETEGRPAEPDLSGTPMHQAPTDALKSPAETNITETVDNRKTSQQEGNADEGRGSDD